MKALLTAVAACLSLPSLSMASAQQVPAWLPELPASVGEVLIADAETATL